MEEPKGRTPAPDDTAAFQRFYTEADRSTPDAHGFLYRALIGWWRDRR